MIELQPVQPQDPRSFWELQRHGEIRAIARRITAAVSSLFQLGFHIVSEGWCQLRGRVITLLPEKMAIRLDPRRMLIRLIREMPPDERVDFTRTILELISPQIDQNIQNTFIETVAANLRNDEGKLVRSILPLVTIEMYSSKNIEITQIVAAIPANEREEVIRSSLSFITSEMILYDVAEIIQIVATIPANEREEVIRSSLLFITPEMMIHDVAEIIQAVATIPANEKEEVIRSSLSFITPEMMIHDVAEIIQTVAAIPANEREEVIRRSLLSITPEMTASGICRMIQAVAAIVANQREEALALLPRPREGMSVHANDRDQRVKAAIELLFEHQKHITTAEICKAKDSFIAYLKESPIDKTKKILAQRALLESRRNNRDFGPLINDEGFTMLGLQILGADLIGRLWIFVSKLNGNEQTNGQVGMISALSDSYNDSNSKVCNQGKIQRLIVAVLQGRLAGVNVEGNVTPTTPQAIEMFFNIEAHKKIDQLKDLMEAANQFFYDNACVNRDTFIPEIEEYARLQGIEN